MRFPLFIARRFLLGKKSINVINVITGVTIFGLSLGTAALILILSVFNGFGDLVGGLFNAFNPDIKVTPTVGKTFMPDSVALDQIKKIDGVVSVASALEEKALLEYKNIQDVGTIKGVNEEFMQVTTFDSTLRIGYFDPWQQKINQCAVGAGLAKRLNVNTSDVFSSMKVYMPRKNSNFALDKPFSSKAIQPTGVFSFQQEYDYEYMIAPLWFLQDLKGSQEIGAWEIKLKDLKYIETVKSELENILGPDFTILDRYEQDAEFLRLMKIEKWMGFAITSLTLFVLSFTIIGTLWMIVLDKRLDIAILKSMGATNDAIRRIFFTTGVLITASGMSIGLVIALIFYGLQKKFGLISIPEGFIVDSYPIELYWGDVFVSLLTVMFIGIVASILPALKAVRVGHIVDH